MLDYQPKQIRFGGLRLAANKALSTQRPIQSRFIPNELIVPVAANGQDTTRIVVERGQLVHRNQTLAIADGGGWIPDAHASTSGRVTSIEGRLVPIGSELRELDCVIIETDGLDRSDDSKQLHWPIDRAAQLEALRAAGIVGLGGAAYPTAGKIDQLRRCDALIINGAECEPYISCDDMLMREFSREIIAGSVLLSDIAQAPICIIAIETDKPEAIDAMSAAAENTADSRLRIARIPSVYPAGGERQLLEIITGAEVPSGSYPSNINYICINVGTAHAVRRFAQETKPLISRVVTVTGGGVNAPQNVEVLIGTPIAELIEHCGGYSDAVARLIVGGSMMGVALPHDSIPVTKSTNCIIAAQASEIGLDTVEWPCIRCADCADACPVRLQPQELLRASRSGDHSALELLALEDCIECGCCDVVCPSHIPLTRTFIDAKRVHRVFKNHNDLAEQAHARFQTRERRMRAISERGEAQKERLLSRLASSESDRSDAIAEAVKRAAGKRARPDNNN